MFDNDKYTGRGHDYRIHGKCNMYNKAIEAAAH